MSIEMCISDITWMNKQRIFRTIQKITILFGQQQQPVKFFSSCAQLKLSLNQTRTIQPRWGCLRTIHHGDVKSWCMTGNVWWNASDESVLLNLWMSLSSWNTSIGTCCFASAGCLVNYENFECGTFKHLNIYERE